MPIARLPRSFLKSSSNVPISSLYSEVADISNSGSSSYSSSEKVNDINRQSTTTLKYADILEMLTTLHPLGWKLPTFLTFPLSNRGDIYLYVTKGQFIVI